MADITIGSLIVEDQGEGPALIMIHGLGGTSNSFQTLMPSLGKYRVLRPDLPGAGRSDMRPGRAGLQGLASAVRECLNAVGIHRAHFVGHSMGTLICQYIAADTPELVSGMTLFGPILEPPVAARQGLKERAEIARTKGMAGIADAVSNASVNQDKPVAAAFVRESLLRQDPAGYASHCEALAWADAANHSLIKCPTLLVAGENDPVAPVAMARLLEQKIENARLEIIPQVSHWMMVEAPDCSTRLLSAQLTQGKAD